jgi:hypothetical protein
VLKSSSNRTPLSTSTSLKMNVASEYFYKRFGHSRIYCTFSKMIRTRSIIIAILSQQCGQLRYHDLESDPFRYAWRDAGSFDIGTWQWADAWAPFRFENSFHVVTMMKALPFAILNI